MANRIIDAVARLTGWVLCAALVGLGFGESAAGVDLIVPGEVGMVVAGAAGRRAGVPLWALLASAVVGAVLGDQVSYHLGKRYGVSLVDRWSWTRRHFKPKIEGAREHFDGRGASTVFVARWVGALRAVVPFVAGTADMPVAKFTAWNVVGSLTWASTVVTLGYVFGRPIADVIDRFALVLSLVAVVLIGGWWLYKWRRSKHDDERAPAPVATGERAVVGPSAHD
jgi:undecaprenyl-diphosphatase